MATPRNISTSTAAGTKLRRGRFTPAYISLLDQIAAAAPGTWLKANINTFQDSWPNSAWLPGYATNSGVKGAEIPSGNPISPAKIIVAWASFAWDDDNMRVILFGGGHANTADNSVYMWEGATGQWKLAFYPTRNKWAVAAEGPPATMDQMPVDGSLNGPSSAHTYSNQLWLPKLQKFITFGGANHNTGWPWNIYDDAGNKLRMAGPYTLDMTLAGQGYVGSTTGANPKKVGTLSEGVDLPGAHAWSNRDWRKDHPNQAMAAKATLGRSAIVTEENGHDVIYWHGGSGTSKDLMRVELVDNDYHNDIISQVGVAWSNSTGDAQAAYDPERKIFLDGSYRPELNDAIGGWDLTTPGAGNKFFSCPAAGITGPGAAEFLANMSNAECGNIYDERRKCFIVFSRHGAIFELKPPASGPLTTGWTVRKIASHHANMLVKGVAQGDTTYETGLTGKWKRSKKLDVYVHLQHPNEGNIWMFKPHDWLDPRNA